MATQSVISKTAHAVKHVYIFGRGISDGNAAMKDLLGGKGANLAETANLRLPVPAGFAITAECCVEFFPRGMTYPPALKAQVEFAFANVEKLMGKKFGDPLDPLLVACRSGVRSSMPGIMETVLNLGLSFAAIPGLVKKTQNERFVYDACRRLIMMYSDVVMDKAEGIEPAGDNGIRKQLDDLLAAYKAKKHCRSDADLTVADLKFLCGEFKKTVKKVLKSDFPDDARAQHWGGAGAVFKSWRGKKAAVCRRIEGIPDDWGASVNVQSMVSGNMDGNSATGAFARDHKFYGEWLINAQGEDVVSGARTPNPLNDDTKNEQNKHLPSLQELLPAVCRGWGKCCIVGTGQLKINATKGAFSAGGFTFKEGDIVSLNGTRGYVCQGEVATIFAADCEKALKKLFPFVKKDVMATWKAMAGQPVTVRLTDPPLHEFIPHRLDQKKEIAEAPGITRNEFDKRAGACRECNPMMGCRGMRLGVTYPEITAMQTRAILESAAEIIGKGGKCQPEIMIPVTCAPGELRNQKKIIADIAARVRKKYKLKKLDCLAGTVIEIPRAAILADRMAEEAEFFSFGTNDLTQMTFGFNRDDAGCFLDAHLDKKILDSDPFQTIDRSGVGFLIHHAVEAGRSVRKNLKTCICGGQGGDPKSAAFCHQRGLSCVSCSPFRASTAHLAAAQAAIANP